MEHARFSRRERAAESLTGTDPTYSSTYLTDFSSDVSSSSVAKTEQTLLPVTAPLYQNDLHHYHQLLPIS